MPVQTFIRERPDTLPSADEQTAERERRLALLRSTGFNQLSAWEMSGEDKLFTATTLFPELTGKSFKLWRGFLPTTPHINEYRYDIIPTEALEAIRTAQQLNCFSRIEIWTPEGNSFFGLVARKLEVAKDKLEELSSRIDPMAVGVVVDHKGREHYVQIVRWGESLLPISQIKRHIRTVNWKARMLLVVLPILIVLGTIAALLDSVQQNGYENTIIGTLTAFCVIGSLGLVAIMVAEARSRNRVSRLFEP